MSYGCSGHTGSVARLDTTLDTQPLPDVPDSRYLDPTKLKLAGASPSSPVLAVVWGWWNGSLVDVWDVSGATPRVIASRSRPEGMVEPFDVAVSPDAGTVFVAAIKTGGQLARYGALAFASSDLSDRGFYETAPYIAALGVSPDGRHLATGAGGPEEPNLLVFPVGTFSPTHMRWYPGATMGSLAWAPDGTTVYVPGGLGDGSSALHMAHGLGVDPGQVEVTAPAGLLANGAPATISGRVRTTDGTPAAGLPVKVTRSGPDGTRTLPALTAGPAGAFSLTDIPSAPAVSPTASRGPATPPTRPPPPPARSGWTGRLPSPPCRRPLREWEATTTSTLPHLARWSSTSCTSDSW